MSQLPTIESLQTEIKRLNQKLNQETSVFREHWRQRIHNDECNLILLDELLGEITSRLHISSANVFIFNPSQEMYETVAFFPAVQDTIQKKMVSSVEDFPYLTKLLFLGKPFYVNSMTDLPEYNAERLILEKSGQQAILCVPIMHEGILYGALALHHPQKNYYWDAKEIEMAVIAASSVFDIYHKYQNKFFHEWLESNEINLSRADDISVLERCLKEFCQLIDIDSIIVFLVSLGKDKHVDKPAFSYPPCITEQSIKDKGASLEFPFIHKQLYEGNIVAINDYRDLPDAAKKEKALFKILDQTSTLAIPLVHNNKICAFLDLHTTGRKHFWSQREIEYAKKIFPLLFSAYQKIQSQSDYLKSLATLQLVLDATQVSYCICNKDTDKNYYSPTVLTMFGYPLSTKINYKWTMDNVFFYEGAGLVVDAWLDDIFHNKAPPPLIMKCKTATNEVLSMKLSFTPFSYEDNGGIESLLIGVTNISEEVKKQKALNKARIEANKANEAKSNFLACMSHEIRTPMNAILGMTHLVQDTQLNPTQKEQVTHIDQAAQSLLGIINDILDFSKIESGSINIEETNFDLLELMQQITYMVSCHEIDSKKKLIINIDKKTPNYVRGDPLRLRQILTNILSNAIKFTEQGHVYLNIHPVDGRHIHFSITDDGIGMTKVELDHLFEPFTQADSSTSRKFGGTGLGLSIVKHLIELMGSQINVNSEVGKGSEFSFTLQLEPSLPIEGKPEEAKTPDNFNLNGLYVLLVEDNIVNQKVAKGMLSKQGVITTIVNNGQEAINILMSKKQHFDLILMDIEMPVVDGYQATHYIRNDLHIDIPIVAMTAHVMDDVREKCLATGMNGHIHKPIGAVLLYSAIASSLKLQ